jgi:mannose-6-phosphate isomerase-like protein (cupin superfamily)
MMKKIGLTMLLGFAVTGILMAVSAKTSDDGIVRSLPQVRFEQDEDVKCLKSSLESGDPRTGPSTYILRAPNKCIVPWHYHTAEEQLVVIRGSVLREMVGMPSSTLGAGGFALMPSKKHHQFSCRSDSDCLMIVIFDRPYEIFWLETRGNL